MAPNDAAITPRALLPRAVQTFGWFSSAELDGNTAYVPYTYDPSALDPGLSSTGIYWLDWCSTAWCDYYTTCSSGSVVGPNTAFACNDSNNGKCVTEALLPFYGASVPLLRKVGCNAADWVTRTYYQRRPASSYNYAQPAINWAATTDPATLSSTSIATTTGASSQGSSTSAQSTSTSVSSPSDSAPTATQSPSNGGGGGTNNAAIIAGSVVGGIALIGMFVLAAIYMVRRTRKHKADPYYRHQENVAEVNHDTIYYEAPAISAAGPSHGELQGDSSFAKERPGNVQRY